jgi:hypothetical protein
MHVAVRELASKHLDMAMRAHVPQDEVAAAIDYTTKGG